MESSPITPYSIVTEQPVRLKTCLDPVPPVPTKRDVIEDCCVCACCYGSLPDWGKRDDSRSRGSSFGSCSSVNDVDNCREDERDHILVEDSFTSVDDGLGDTGDKSEGFDSNWWSRDDGTNAHHFGSDTGDCFSHDHGGGGDSGGDCGGGDGGGGGE